MGTFESSICHFRTLGTANKHVRRRIALVDLAQTLAFLDSLALTHPSRQKTTCTESVPSHDVHANTQIVGMSCFSPPHTLQHHSEGLFFKMNFDCCDPCVRRHQHTRATWWLSCAPAVADQLARTCSCVAAHHEQQSDEMDAIDVWRSALATCPGLAQQMNIAHAIAS